MTVTTTRPDITPDSLTQEFWAACDRQQLLVQSCNDCQHAQFYPRPFCRHCGGTTLAMRDATGNGVLHTFTVVERAAPGFEDQAPYVVGVVETDEHPRMVGNVVDVDPGDLRIGMALQVRFRHDGHRTVPVWTKPEASR